MKGAGTSLARSTNSFSSLAPKWMWTSPICRAVSKNQSVCAQVCPSPCRSRSSISWSGTLSRRCIKFITSTMKRTFSHKLKVWLSKRRLSIIWLTTGPEGKRLETNSVWPSTKNLIMLTAPDSNFLLLNSYLPMKHPSSRLRWASSSNTRNSTSKMLPSSRIKWQLIPLRPNSRWLFSRERHWQRQLVLSTKHRVMQPELPSTHKHQPTLLPLASLALLHLTAWWTIYTIQTYLQLRTLLSW